MKRMRKALLMVIRHAAYRWNRLKTFYWAEEKLYELRSVYLVPTIFYRGLFLLCMRLTGHRQFHKLADRMIHLIPYHVRFQVA